ncbi:MAG TPA: glycosyltransferase [Candidatus Limnocylindria bacterium]
MNHSTLVSLTPDWIDDFGHFGPFERRIHGVAEAAGYRHIALANAGLIPTADWQVPTFSEFTFAAGDGTAPVGPHFEGELRDALGHHRPGPGSIVLMYTADVWHLAAIIAVAPDHPGVRFVTNLMRSHGWIARALESPDPSVAGLLELLTSCLGASSGTNVDVAVDTEALARDVERLTGRAVLRWPMIALSDAPDGRRDREGAMAAIHIVAPVHAQNAKGFPDLVALAERVSERLQQGELRLTARSPAAGTGVHSGMRRLAERFEEQGGHLVTDNMTDVGFADLIASADVALIPYRLRPFRTRTSSVTIDALLAGKPVVAVRGTWAGNLVERYGAGLTYTEGDAADMDDAISGVIGRIGAYRRRLAEMRSIIEAEHAPDRLIDFLRGRASSADGTGIGETTAGNAPL